MYFYVLLKPTYNHLKLLSHRKEILSPLMAPDYHQVGLVFSSPNPMVSFTRRKEE